MPCEPQDKDTDSNPSTCVCCTSVFRSPSPYISTATSHPTYWYLVCLRPLVYTHAALDELTLVQHPGLGALEQRLAAMGVEPRGELPLPELQQQQVQQQQQQGPGGQGDQGTGCGAQGQDWRLGPGVAGTREQGAAAAAGQLHGGAGGGNASVGGDGGGAGGSADGDGAGGAGDVLVVFASNPSATRRFMVAPSGTIFIARGEGWGAAGGGLVG